MRKHGWELPYHPLQVVAVAVFLALGFAFYVFFAPFLVFGDGNNNNSPLFQYIAMGIYTPLIICAFGLYIWCAGADPADPGVFRSKKYLNIPDNKKHPGLTDSKHCGESTSSIPDANAVSNGEEPNNGKGQHRIQSAADRNTETENKSKCATAMLALLPCAYLCSSRDQSSDQQSEDGMFYCSLCEVEVFKYSKHCRVCDKCVDCFDHHCRWLNNCIGKRNYRKFFTLMVSSLLLLILQWSTGILVLVLCFLEKKKFAADISTKLGSSFTVVPFVIVVGVCTILAMIATLPLAQLFFFHILLIKKGMSTYDYIIALREQEQGGGGQQSPQMSQASSITGLSSASSFNTFNRAAWCTPPRLFVEDQYDVVPPDNMSVSSLGKKTATEEPTKKKNPAPVKISPWALARLNADDVSRAAAEARKKSKILRPVTRHHEPTYALETDSSYDSSGRRVVAPKPENSNKKQRGSRRIRLPADMPHHDPLSRIPSLDIKETSTSLAPLHNEARSEFRVGRSAMGPNEIVASSPESSLEYSPDIHPLGAEEARRRLVALSGNPAAQNDDMPLSRSTSGGYDASGGEDSDRVATRIIHKPSNWSSLLFGSEQTGRGPKYISPSSSTLSGHRKF